MHRDNGTLLHRPYQPVIHLRLDGIFKIFLKILSNIVMYLIVQEVFMSFMDQNELLFLYN